MTSKVSSATKRKFTPTLHELLWTVRRYWWLALSGMLLFSLLTIAGKRLEGNQPNTFTLIVQDLEVLMPIAAVLFGILAAFCMFRFLWSRRESMLYLSVGTSRAKQFLLRYVFGFVSVVVGILVPFLITYYTELAEVGDDYFGLCAHYTTVYVVSLLLIALLAYTVAVLIATLCGSFLGALLSTAGVLGAPYAVLWGSQTMLRFYLFGTPLGRTLLTDHLGAGLFTMYSEQLAYVEFSKSLLDRYWVIANSGGLTVAENYKAELATLPVARTTLLVVLMIALAALACFVYCQRPAEHAGKAYVHPILSHAVAVADGFCIAALVLTLKAPTEGFFGVAILTALFVLAFILAAALLRLILTRNFKGVLKQYYIPCGAGAVGLVLAILLGTGWFGYATYLPDPMEVQSVKVTYNQNFALFSHLGQSRFSGAHAPDFKGAGMSGTNEGSPYYYTFLYAYGISLDEDRLPKLTSPEDIETVLSIHEAVIADGKQTYTGNPSDEHAESVVPVFYRVIYTLKNGKTLERYYEYLSLATLEKTVEVEDTQAFCEEIAKSHANNYFVDADSFEFGDPFFANFTAVTLSDDDRVALATALDKDNAMLGANDRYFSKDAQGRVIGIIRVKSVAQNSMLGMHPFDRQYQTYYITEAWENTLAFIREKGLDVHFEGDYTITDVRYQRYTTRYAPNRYSMAASYVFFSCENTVQIRLPDSFDGRGIKDNVVLATEPVPAELWDACLESSRPIALMTRPGVMVQIILTNAKGEERLVTRYLYDEDLTLG
ncbi:MAG: hypothetical protein IKB28_02760 [Clostridia bacterium]|nr:hypothetical protein [Clostridia bacterium]MBR2445568.1 hypothetical protein [Clostridia bacterium]